MGSYHGHGSRAWWVVKNSTLPIPDFNATVFDNNGSENENFGQRVAVHGNLVAVCRAGSNNQDLKRVYIYEVDEYGALSFKYIVAPSDADSASSSWFGDAIDIENGLLLVGADDAYDPDTFDSEVGAVYLFDINGSNPVELARFDASDAAAWKNFGSSVSISGNLIVVGAYRGDPNGNQNAGSAYVFRRESNGDITEITKLTAPDGRSNDYFGSAVAVDGNFLRLVPLVRMWRGMGTCRAVLARSTSTKW